MMMKKQVGRERMEILDHIDMFMPNTGALRAFLTGIQKEFSIPNRRTRMLYMRLHFQQKLIGHKVLFMTTLLISTRILHQTTEPPWEKILSSCNYSCRNRNLCAIPLRGQWAEFQALYLLDTGICCSDKGIDC